MLWRVKKHSDPDYKYHVFDADSAKAAAEKYASSVGEMIESCYVAEHHVGLPEYVQYSISWDCFFRTEKGPITREFVVFHDGDKLFESTNLVDIKSWMQENAEFYGEDYIRICNHESRELEHEWLPVAQASFHVGDRVETEAGEGVITSISEDGTASVLVADNHFFRLDQLERTE